MAATSLANPRLSEYCLDDLPRLRRLRARLIRARPEICIERAQFITHYFRDLSTDAMPAEIRYAEAVRHYLTNKRVVFNDDNLLAGSTTSKSFGVPVYPELTGLKIWSELDTISERKNNPIQLSREDAAKLNSEVFPYWIGKNVLERTRKRFGNPECLRLFERLVFFLSGKVSCISHTIPHYRTALEKGVLWLIRTAAAKEKAIRKYDKLTQTDRQKILFYQAVQSVLQGVVLYAQHLSWQASRLAAVEKDPSRAANFRKIAEVCGRVPALPARTFREAVNALWILHIGILAENTNMAMSPGRLDQVLYKYYRQDIDSGRLTVKEAMELVGCLWLKFNDNTVLVPEAAGVLFGGAGPVAAVTVGGVDEEGHDAVNDLTYIMLRITELLRTRDPNLNARFHYTVNTQEYRNRLAEVIAGTKSVPAIHNDIVDIAILEHQGVETRHARDYAIIGCVEIGCAGRSYDASSSIMLNLVSVLELTLYNGKRPVTGDEQIGPQTGDPVQFRDMAEFMEAFKKQYQWLAEKAIEMNECFGLVHQESVPSPLLSALFEGPMEKGKDLVMGGALYNSSGATHIGFADTIDSFNAIEQAVFTDGVTMFEQLLEALADDFVGHENLYAYLVNKTPKYGSRHPVALKNARNLVRFLYEFYQSHTNYRGGKYRPAYWTMTNHAGQGKFCSALPHGRRAHQPFASGITPVSQVANDLSACLAAVASLDGMYIPGGAAFNLKCPYLCRPSDAERLGQTIEAYFRLGGIQIQFNILSYETLIDAKQHPEKYPDLLVRVSGYSAYFKDLNEDMKNEIITRTEYDLRTGSAVPFPEGEGELLLRHRQ